MEVIEHVANPQAFTRICVDMLKPEGLMFVATISRTLKSFGLAIIGAEYVLRWLPKGTHQWEKFITPAELKTWLADNHITIKGETGVTYHPLANEWREVARHGCELHAGGGQKSLVSNLPAVSAADELRCLLRSGPWRLRGLASP